jgi:hypothetical protein
MGGYFWGGEMAGLLGMEKGQREDLAMKLFGSDEDWAQDWNTVMGHSNIERKEAGRSASNT